MAANRCAGLDPTWAHWSHACSWLNPAAAFENEALTSALRASMMPPAAAASSLSGPATPSSSTSSASGPLSSGHDAAAPTTAVRALARPARGRVAKRKPRPSRRAQTTYITADPADFRRMVQEVTGSYAAATASYAAPRWTAPPACVLPTLDTSASFLLDHAATFPRGAEDRKSPTVGASAAGDGDEDSSMLQELEAMMRAPPAASRPWRAAESSSDAEPDADFGL